MNRYKLDKRNEVLTALSRLSHEEFKEVKEKLADVEAFILLHEFSLKLENTVGKKIHVDGTDIKSDTDWTYNIEQTTKEDK